MISSACSKLAPALLVVTGAVAHGQQPTFRVSADTVRLDVLVADGRNPITGLSAADFDVRDNGVRQQVDAVSVADAAHIVIVLDVSGSVQGDALRHLTDAADGILQAATSRDRVTMLSFSEHVSLVSIGAGVEGATRAITAQTLAPGGSTSLHDAVFAGLLESLDDERSAFMILLTDGIDNVSWLGRDDLLATASMASVVVYPVGVRLKALRDSPDAPLRERYGLLVGLAEATGGAIDHADSTQDLGRLFLDILAEHRQRYVVSYTPSQVQRGGRHELRVRVSRPGATVRTRRAYVVPGEG